MSCLPIATQAEAEGGVVNDKIMTPLRTKEAIDTLGVTQDALASLSGSEMVGTIQNGIGAIGRTQRNKNNDLVNVLDFIPVSEHAGILNGTSTYNATPDVQRAVNAVNSLSGGTLIVRGTIFLGGSINIDRKVNMTTGDLVIQGIGNGAGFHCTSAITMICSSSEYGADPVNERVVFNNIRFSCDNAITAAYVMSEQFLRIEFLNCRFEKIKCNNCTIYMQSWRWINCGVWRWSGSFSKTVAQAYDCHAVMAKFEGASVGGDAWDWAIPTGSSVHQGLYEGAFGCHVRATACNGFSVAGNYTENTNTINPDYVFALQSVGAVSRGVSFTGNHINTLNPDPAFYPVVLGRTTGSAGGNSANTNLYDDADTRTGDFGSVGDSALGRLQKSNVSLAVPPGPVKSLTRALVAHAGGGQALATLLPSQVNIIATVATANDSVILPAPSGNSLMALEVYALNNGANPSNVYPPVGFNFEGAGTNMPHSLAGGGTSKTFRYIGTGVWTLA